MRLVVCRGPARRVAVDLRRIEVDVGVEDPHGGRSGGGVNLGQLPQHALQLPEVSLLRELGLAGANLGEPGLQRVAAGAGLGGEAALLGAGNQVELVGAQAVERGPVAGAARREDAAEPVGRRAEAVAVVIEQRMLGGEAAGRLVELPRAVGGGG